MGNICSTSQKNCKDAESEISEGADNGCQDIERKSQTPEEDGDKNAVPDTGNMNSPEVNKPASNIESSTAAPQSDSDETEERNNTSMYSKICGSPISSRKTERTRKIVIYILMSNKCDYKQQLEAISKLFPSIWTHCKVKGFELTKSFTHHEISSRNENSSSPQDTLIDNALEIKAAHEDVANYLAEIARHSQSYIIPILFLGSSLGKPYIPISIEKQDFTSLLATATREQSDLLQRFYKIDNHSQPACYGLVTDSTLQKECTEEILVTLIQLMSIDLKNSYLATVVEQEITSAIIKTKELAKRCIWIQGDYVATATAVNPAIEAEMSRRLSVIQSQLRDVIDVRNSIPSIDDPEELHELLGDAMKSSVDAIMHEHHVNYHHSRNTLGMCKQILAEIGAVKAHSIAIGENCTNTHATEAITRYIRGDSLHPLVVSGRPGEGKSTLAAEIAMKSDKWIANSHLILRYANLTELSSEISSLLASIAEQLSILIAGERSATHHGILDYKRAIERLLDSTKLYIIIVIDSVDKVVGATDFSWLPKISKHNIKIILTITDNDDNQENMVLNQLTKMGIPKENILPLHGKPVNSSSNGIRQQDHIFERNPFQAKVISKLTLLGVNVKEIDTDKLIEKLFLALESKIDTKFLEILLVIISISTYGIYETDCVNIFREETKTDKIHSLIVWSKFCWIVGPMLLHADKIKIMDKTFQEAILKRYSGKILGMQKSAKRYYENLSDSFVDVEKNLMCVNAEKYLKVPLFDLAISAEGDNKSVLEDYFNKYYFRDLSWMLNKINSTGCFQYLNDILIPEGLHKTPTTDLKHITILKQFLTLHMTQLNCDGSQFYTLFKRFVKNCISKDATLESNNYIKEWTAAIDQLKVTYLECLNSEGSEANHNPNESYNDVVSLKGAGYFVAAINTEGDEISVWDVPNCKRIRILKSVPQPSLLCSISDFEAAVLCKREIKVIDLKEGQYKSTLKGVMNQKVPYFGLHDDSHLVCLSRNRMYVNLMNLQSGDCVTSFKAGEDRFLNSLIVSGNGRILVCGDESQKPFSLLVWHLSQRRLLYDLRIPHHDLFTSLSAITYEGSYVSVVAKEIRESGPNFIVVYDLQSGTLFQKLKPICNTVAIAISQANGCVIAGLENAEILIWDLVTGNCRHTLIGHNAPVTLLKLDPLGSCLLSGDKDGRDLSLRLWELGTGNSLAVFSPPHKTSSCEILDNGIFIILALENVPDVLILRLRNYNKAQTQSEQCSNEISDCKIFNLNED